MKSREEAWALLTSYTQEPHLIRHALAVEAAMRGCAQRLGEDVELWGTTGLLHDFDYERFPTLDDHPFKGSEILRQEGYPEALVVAILGHGNHTGVPRTTALAHHLFAVDELTGLVMAVAMVKGRDLSAVEAGSVLRKMKDKAFARGVNRQDVLDGAAEIGLPLEMHIGHVIADLRQVAPALGLAGA